MSGVKMPSDPYKPIACADYDIYEIAIMQKKQLFLEWMTLQGEFMQETVTPLELKIIDGAEYLFFDLENEQKNKNTQKLRLDKINSATIC